ncbi:glycogen debranching protein GlgX [Polaromonas sp.]|uniref:glycogen debranching protein GlgX n=1 Tax=Polaromonas sp. TaxID=1869339 RepID=UPI0013BAA19F|nr:glycogen debranching protein GlgX [Polaromonas sp.]NDP64381.1 glycogen debranching protein GlgX [Polaromonas sp.]
MNTIDQLLPGKPWPLGAHWDGQGVNFAVFSAHASAIELCLFDEAGTLQTRCECLPGHTDDIWHGYLPNAAPGLIYGLRAQGEWQPEHGHYFNPNKLLLDPYAREVVGIFEWRDENFPYVHPSPPETPPEQPPAMDGRDNAPWALKARVVQEDSFDWSGDQSPGVLLPDTVLYEAHVKGFSRRNPAVPEALRGSYAGLADPASLAHLKRLGVTSVSLLPVHYALDEERLAGMGLSNYWGYNSLAFFAPSTRLASQQGGVNPRDEFRAMVKALHAEGLEVILDVVYNHTAEADGGGPCISFRGLDNASYYRLSPEPPVGFENHSGCGNTLDIRQPRVLQLVMDSLRYWVQSMHVDGFRFDLAPVLGRSSEGFERDGAFFTAVAQDPVLSTVKMIAEPWDIGPGGYQVGGFAKGWLEWNDHFRDGMRSFWLQTGEQATSLGDFAKRLCGSADLYQGSGRPPSTSVNYLVSHDGFTLADLVSHNERHNEANGEDNRDGHGNNLSNNCGAEGPTDDEHINELRGHMQRALLATTLLAQGTPMLCAGDELGHSQQGNNNPYCQDNEITWIDWAKADDDLIDFTAWVLSLRRQLLPFGNHWYSGLSDTLGLHDLHWRQASGEALEGDDWGNPDQRLLGCLIGQPGRAKAPLLLLVNPEVEAHDVLLPAGVWQAVLDTSHPRGLTRWQGQGEAPFALAAHSLVLLVAAGTELRC